jgi:hypothetical protein
MALRHYLGKQTGHLAIRLREPVLAKCIRDRMIPFHDELRQQVSPQASNSKSDTGK